MQQGNASWKDVWLNRRDTGLPSLDINSFHVHLTLKTELQVVRSIYIHKNKNNQKREGLNSWHQNLIAFGASSISRATAGLNKAGKLNQEPLHKTSGHSELEARGAFLARSPGFRMWQWSWRQFCSRVCQLQACTCGHLRWQQSRNHSSAQAHIALSARTSPRTPAPRHFSKAEASEWSRSWLAALFLC